ncbi:hypothetical protein, partial [Halorubrum sp. SP3]
DLSKSELRELPIASDPKLATDEKETTLTFPNDVSYGRVHTSVPTLVKWVLSVEASEILSYQRDESGNLVAVRAEIPKGIVKFQQSARKSDAHSQMVSYGPNDFGGDE